MAGPSFREELMRLVDTFSQAEVARMAGVSQSTISRILSGDRVGNVRTAMRIIQAYPELGRVFLSHDTRE